LDFVKNMHILDEMGYMAPKFREAAKSEKHNGSCGKKETSSIFERQDERKPHEKTPDKHLPDCINIHYADLDKLPLIFEQYVIASNMISRYAYFTKQLSKMGIIYDVNCSKCSRTKENVKIKQDLLEYLKEIPKKIWSAEVTDTLNVGDVVKYTTLVITLIGTFTYTKSFMKWIVSYFQKPSKKNITINKQVHSEGIISRMRYAFHHDNPYRQGMNYDEEDLAAMKEGTYTYDREIHEAKPWVKYSVSPFGIFRAGHPEGMPPPIAGFDQYSQIYCDAKLWLQQGWLDILQPQLYWRIDPPAQSYPVLLDWWVADTQNLKGRHVFAGNYLTRVEIPEHDWPLDEIRRQVDISRQPQNRLRGSWGNVMFSAKMFRDDSEGTASFFEIFVYPELALQPEYSWLASNNASLMQLTAPQPKILLKSSGQTSIDFGLENMPEIFNQVAIYKMKSVDEWTLFKILPMKDALKGEGITLENGHYIVSVIDRFGREGEKTYFEV